MFLFTNGDFVRPKLMLLSKHTKPETCTFTLQKRAGSHYGNVDVPSTETGTLSPYRNVFLYCFRNVQFPIYRNGCPFPLHKYTVATCGVFLFTVKL